MLRAATAYQKHLRQSLVFVWHDEARMMMAGIGLFAGCLLYLSLPIEPAPVILGLIFLLVLSLSILTTSWFKPEVIFGLAVCVGLCLSQMHAHVMGTPAAISKPVFLTFNATVDRIERFPDRVDRLSVVPDAADGQLSTSGVLRLTDRTGAADAYRPGDRIAVSARLVPPGGPVLPGGYDFARRAYFDGIAAVGFITQSERLGRASGPPAIEAARLDMAQRWLGADGDQGRALAATLLLGWRQGLSEETLTSFRQSGLAHFLAISGLHIGMIAVIVIVALEYAIACIPSLAGRIYGRRWAAMGALFVAFLYLMISGAALSTQRAFIMLLIGILGLWLGRVVISLRSVAIAGLLILIFSPSAAGSVSFQMSFAATIGLVACFERWRLYRDRRREDWNTQAGAVAKWVAVPSKFLIGTFATTVIAQLSITPVALYQFQSESLAAVFANLFAMPVMLFWVMPSGLITLLLSALGLEGLSLPVLAAGCDQLIAISRTFSELPGGVVYVPQLPGWSFIGVVGACLLLVVARGWGSLAGAAVLLLLSLVPLRSLPDETVFISGRTPQIAVAQTWGGFEYSGGRTDGFRFQSWRQAAGVSPDQALSRLSKACSGPACVYSSAAGTRIGVVDASLEGTACPQSPIVIVKAGWCIRGGDTLPGSEDPVFLRIGHIQYDGPVVLKRYGNDWRRWSSRPRQPTRPWHLGYHQE